MTDELFSDLNIVRDVDLDQLGWPTAHAAQEDGWLGGNYQYLALVGLRWSEVEDMLELEAELMERVSHAPDPAHEEGVVQDELLEWDVGLQGLDLGVAAAVAALSASGCIPFSSCNGGAFGRSHHEVFPLVAFYSRREIIPLLLEGAADSNVGIMNGDEGELILHANHIEAMSEFAKAVLRNAQRFDATQAAR